MKIVVLLIQIYCIKIYNASFGDTDSTSRQQCMQFLCQNIGCLHISKLCKDTLPTASEKGCNGFYLRTNGSLLRVKKYKPVSKNVKAEKQRKGRKRPFFKKPHQTHSGVRNDGKDEHGIKLRDKGNTVESTKRQDNDTEVDARWRHEEMFRSESVTSMNNSQLSHSSDIQPKTRQTSYSQSTTSRKKSTSKKKSTFHSRPNGSSKGTKKKSSKSRRYEQNHKAETKSLKSISKFTKKEATAKRKRQNTRSRRCHNGEEKCSGKVAIKIKGSVGNRRMTHGNSLATDITLETSKTGTIERDETAKNVKRSSHSRIQKQHRQVANKTLRRPYHKAKGVSKPNFLSSVHVPRRSKGNAHSSPGGSNAVSSNSVKKARDKRFGHESSGVSNTMSSKLGHNSRSKNRIYGRTDNIKTGTSNTGKVNRRSTTSGHGRWSGNSAGTNNRGHGHHSQSSQESGTCSGTSYHQRKRFSSRKRTQQSQSSMGSQGHQTNNRRINHQNNTISSKQYGNSKRSQRNSRGG